MADSDFDAISLEERVGERGRGHATPKPEPNIGLVKVTALLACLGVVILVVMLPVYYKVIAPDSDTSPITEAPITTTKEVEPTEPPVIKTTTKPPVVETTTKPPVVETTTKPPVVEPTTKPPVVETTTKPPTEAPTTQAPTTQPPTTQAATTQAPTTQPPTTQPPTTQAPTTQAATTQPPPPEAERFNCIPDTTTTTDQATCEDRGCVWVETSTAVPSCFYSSDDPSYEVVGKMEEVGKVQSITLKVPAAVTRDTTAQWYGTPFEQLRVEATKMTTERLQIKIFPPGVDRFEVPIELDQVDPVEADDDAYLYDVEFVTGPNFGIKVTRKSSGVVIFDTTVGKMIFADKFLQISTSLPSEYVYGFGEQEHDSFKHDLNWKKFGMFSRDQGVGPDANLYGVHPFHMTMEEEGNAHAILFLNSNAQEVELQPKPALTYRSVGGIMEFDIFLGPKPEEVMDQYTQMIGRPYFPPMWSLGYQLCRYGYGSLDNLKEVVDRMLDSDIPYDVQYSDIDYMIRQLDFTIDNETYDGLTEFVEDLKANHLMKYIIILDPAISSSENDSYPPYDEGVAHDVFIKNSDGSNDAYGKVWPYWPNVTSVDADMEWDEAVETYHAYAVFPDFAKDVTKDWWTNMTVDFHDRIAFDGLWIDMNEPANFVHGSPTGCPDTEFDTRLPFHPGILDDDLFAKTICMSSQQYNPATGSNEEKHYNMHSLYGRLQIKPTLDACRAATNERCIVISRSTFPGSGKHGGHWLGDNSSEWPFLKASLIGMLEFNLFGIPYVGADICGFFNNATRELCLRWSQIGAFYPFARNHNGLGNIDQDPASFDDEFAQTVADILKVRYRILPYFYTLFHHANERGATVVRSLLAEFPEDKNTYAISGQILLGGYILLTPVLDEGATQVTGYFPDSRWFDYYTGDEMSIRKNNVTLEAPLDVLPIHIRGGAIIPTQKPEKTITKQHGNNFGIIYALPDPGVGAEGQLYWDDGLSIVPEILELDFVGNDTSLWSSPRTMDYSVSSVFDTVEILGVHLSDVNTVIVNGASHSNFTFSDTNFKLEINDLHIAMNLDWTISWDYDDSLATRSV